MPKCRLTYYYRKLADLKFLQNKKEVESDIEIESTQRILRLFAFGHCNQAIEDGNAHLIPKIAFTKSFIGHRSSIIIIYHAIQFDEVKNKKKKL